MPQQRGESTLVIPANLAAPGGHTLEIDELIAKGAVHASWMPRRLAEASREHVQIIPVATVHDRDGRYHVFTRNRSDQEVMSEKLTLTVGGHVEHRDQGANLAVTLLNALSRELLEEIGAKETPSEPEFTVFDPRSPHLAVVHRVTVPEPASPITDEFTTKNATLMETQTLLRRMMDQLDPWSAAIVAIRSAANGPRRGAPR